jgi:hypothetical protein
MSSKSGEWGRFTIATLKALEAFRRDRARPRFLIALSIFTHNERQACGRARFLAHKFGLTQ